MENKDQEYSRVVIHLKRILKERNITQRELAAMTGVRQATISALCSKDMEKIHVPSIEKIINALELNSLSDLMTLDREIK